MRVEYAILNFFKQGQLERSFLAWAKWKTQDLTSKKILLQESLVGTILGKKNPHILYAPFGLCFVMSSCGRVVRNCTGVPITHRDMIWTCDCLDIMLFSAVSC